MGNWRAGVVVLVWALAAPAARPQAPPDAPPPADPPAVPTPADPPPEPKADAKPADKPKPLAGWDDTFYLRSADGRFSLRVTGQVQADYRAYLNPADRTDIDTFQLRRARFGLEATLFRYYEFRFMPDYGVGQDRIQDAFLNVHYWDAFQITAGKFKQPFSYEQLIQDRFTPLMERSLIDQLTPARDVGLMAHGQGVFGNRLDYGVAVSNGEQNGNTDQNDGKDVTGRVAVRPFAGWAGSAFERLQVGVSAGIGNQAEPVAPNPLRTPAGVPFFTYNRGVVANGVRSRWTPEAAYFVDGFGFSAQYFHMDQRMGTGAAGPTPVVPFTGFYVQATWLLTGEKRTGYSQAIAPLRPFDPVGTDGRGCGAWELVGRVSRLNVGGVVFAPGAARLADPAAVSSGAAEMTLGFNWYLNRWARVQFNWEHARFDQPVRLAPAPAPPLSTQDTLQTRLQFIF